jgi:hypothetical protein
VLEPDLQPRYWYHPSKPAGSWVMGVDHLTAWMGHFGHEHGLGIEDIARFRALAGPNWSRLVAPIPAGDPAGVPNLDAGSPKHD